MSPLKIMFYAFEDVGHVNPCLGLAVPLLTRGHSVVMVTTRKVERLLTPYSERYEKFECAYFDNDEGLEEPKPGPVAGPSLMASGILQGLSSHEKLKRMVGRPISVRVIGSIKKREPQFRQLIDQHRPDLFVTDHFVPSPSILLSGKPWVYLHSASELNGFFHPDTPPEFSGYPTSEKNESEWNSFCESLVQYSRPARESMNQWLSELGHGPLQILNRRAVIESPFLNVYQYPKELSYTDIRPIPDKWVRVDCFGLGRDQSCELKQNCEFELPKSFQKLSGKLIYLSMGTIGCVDTKLIERLAGILAKLPHRIVVSTGALGDQIDLSQYPNVYGAKFVPQMKMLTEADLVIIHGGNNSFTETFAAGKAMIVTPLFADQFDNAQRILETGYGLRFNPHLVEEDELRGAVEQLLADQQLQKRLNLTRERIQNDNGLEFACDQIEKLIKN